jgi:hypothetical protein
MAAAVAAAAAAAAAEAASEAAASSRCSSTCSTETALYREGNNLQPHNDPHKKVVPMPPVKPWFEKLARGFNPWPTALT